MADENQQANGGAPMADAEQIYEEPVDQPEENPVVTPEVLPMEGDPVPAPKKIKGAAQMAAGGALAAAGVPMLILPGPGAAAIVGGAALVSKGQRNFSGRKASNVEEKLDDAAVKVADATKTAAKAAAHNAAETVAKQAPLIASKAAETAPAVAKKALSEAPRVAQGAATVAKVAAKSGAKFAGKAAGFAVVNGRKIMDSRKR